MSIKRGIQGDSVRVLRLRPFVLARVETRFDLQTVHRRNVPCWLELGEPSPETQPERPVEQTLDDFWKLPVASIVWNGQRVIIPIAVCERIPGGKVVSFKTDDGQTLWTMVPAEAKDA